MPGIADAIRRHGVETYPNECCGALIGADGVVEHVAPLPNTTEEGAQAAVPDQAVGLQVR